MQCPFLRSYPLQCLDYALIRELRICVWIYLCCITVLIYVVQFGAKRETCNGYERTNGHFTQGIFRRQKSGSPAGFLPAGSVPTGFPTTLKYVGLISRQNLHQIPRYEQLKSIIVKIQFTGYFTIFYPKKKFLEFSNADF